MIGHFDIAFTSSVTSAAVDVYSAGLKVISALDPESLNLPLRGVEGVRFVSSSDMLREALRAACLKLTTKAQKVFNILMLTRCCSAGGHCFQTIMSVTSYK